MARTLPRPAAGVAALTALGLALAGCGSGSGGDAAADGTTTLTVAGWSLSTTPEFELLASLYEESHPDVTVEVKEYDASNYDTQLTADLAAGAGPDVYPIKSAFNFPTYQEGGQLADVSDVAAALDDTVGGVDAYTVDGATYAIPYRQDGWYLFYDADLFDTAGIDHPDGTWTWDDYVSTAKQLSAALPDADGTYSHTWQSVVQGFANAQTADLTYLDGDYSYMAQYYDWALDLQDSDATVDYGTASTNSLTYQGQFGTQKAAMMLMGSWYVATLISQQASGDADAFAWSFAPAPQLDAAATAAPVTFGGPTGLGINSAVDDDTLAVAKDFLSFVASEDAGVALAGIGIVPADLTDAVTDAFFAVDGVPQDDLARTAFSGQTIGLEAPIASVTPELQTILEEEHSAIMSGTSTVDAALADAATRAKDALGS